MGGSEEIIANVRVIAATNSPLQQRVESGSFRRDAAHILAIPYPTLRYRMEKLGITK